MSKPIKIYQKNNHFYFAEEPYKDMEFLRFSKNYRVRGRYNFALSPEHDPGWIHFNNFKVIPAPTPPNTISISSRCGQSQITELTGIDPNQPISSITIRGQEWVPA